ncbi:hypothetical protein [Clostridium sp. C8-1-8]|uniref:hypothetical protein n=1 Tax=Clostridium sp. C8-1-8 TaxID=2698831 RepID=UPI00136A3F04|nr:hypothetical protein [Clostridium sp. C8-1-8]
MSGAAAVKHIQNRYINKFQESGALDREHSVTLDELGMRESNVFNRMVKNNIFIKCNNSKFYLDLSALESYKRSKRKLGLYILIALAVFLVFYYLIYN